MVRSMEPWGLLCVALSGFGWARLDAQDSSGVHLAHVTYVVGTSVYLDAGRADGVVEGLQFQLIRGDTVAAIYAAQYLASHQTACAWVSGAKDLQVGETMRYVPRLTAPAKTAPAGTSKSTPASAGNGSRSGLHGRLGVRYLIMRGEGGTGVSQPAGDLRLNGQPLAGAPVALVADIRARQLRVTRADGTSAIDGETRVYELALAWAPQGSPLRAVVGRQFVPELAEIGLLDGASVQLNPRGFSLGAFGGTEPDPVQLGFSRAVQDYGGYFSLHDAPGAGSLWRVTLGGVGSYSGGVANREFGFLQGSYSGPVVSLFATQELDYYRPWKVAAGESSAFSLTSTFADATIRLSRALSIRGGYDTRRNVRLYRDVIDPTVTFDDSYRQGAWGGFGWSSRGVRLGGDVRASFGGPAGRATVYTGSLGLARVTSLPISLGARASWYQTARTTGSLYSLRAGGDLTGPVHLELSGGLRLEHDSLQVPADRQFPWIGADLDVSLGRSWYLLLSGSHEGGPDGPTDLGYLSLTFRF
jgi:hypothetical protein